MKVAIYNFNGVLDHLAIEIYKKGDLVNDWRDADVVVVWQDVMGELQDIALQAKKEGKKVVVSEHGFLSINDYIPPLSRPLVADVFMAWGNHTKEWLTDVAGIPESKVVVTGCPFNSKRIKKVSGTRNVLFAPRHWDGELKENLDIAKVLRQNNFNVFSKILQGENNPSDYPGPIITDRQEMTHIDSCFYALSKADVVVGIGEGTFGALTHLMDIPYISVTHWEDKDLLGKRYTKEEFFSQVTKASIPSTITELNKTINKVLKKPDINKKERAWFRKECLGIGKDFVEEAMEVIYA